MVRKKTQDRVPTKNKFVDAHINEAQVKERDREAFKRNNPLAFKAIQSQNKKLHDDLVDKRKREKLLRDREQGIFGIS